MSLDENATDFQIAYNTTDYLDAEFYESLSVLNKRYADALVPMAFWTGLMAAIGIFGNILVIAVFSICPEYKHTKFKVFVLSLAVVDLLTCVTLLPAEIIKTRHYFSLTDGTPCKVKCFFNLFGQNASSLILLVICVDRYMKVCKPLKPQIWPETASKIILGILFLTFLLSLPAPFLCGVSSANKTNIHGTNTTVFFCASEKKYINSPFRYAYKIGLTVSLLGVSIAYIVMYTLILRTICRHWRNVGRGGSVRFESDEKSGQRDNGEIVKQLKHEEVRILIGFPAGGNQTMSDRDLALVPMKNGVSNGVHTGNKIKTKPSHNGSPKHKAKAGVHKSTSWRSASDHSCSLRGEPSTVASSRIPYKTMIWVILTLVFIVTYFVNALLSFITTKLYELSPEKLLLFTFFFRIYFINNIINPIIYLCLDKRFKISCFHLVNLLKRKWRLMFN